MKPTTKSGIGRLDWLPFYMLHLLNFVSEICVENGKNSTVAQLKIHGTSKGNQGFIFENFNQ